jgi:hypothetical protein
MSKTISFLFQAFCFLLFLTKTSCCFAQDMKKPQDAPHFVYPTSLSLSYGMGKNFTGFNMVPNGNLSFEIQQVLAYQFNNYFFTGVGTGLDFWFYDKKVSTFIPIFANLTIKMMNRKTSPFLFTNVGYAFKWQSEKNLERDFFYGTKAGIYFQAGLGLNIKFSSKLSLLLSGFYKMQQSAVQYRENALLLVETDNQLFHFAGIKISLLY